MAFPCPDPKIIFNGKSHSLVEFKEVLKSMDVSELAKYAEGVTSIPSMPFEKNWSELAFRRAVQYAASNGFDAVSWTTGEMQNARYDLSKQVESVMYTTNSSLSGRTNGDLLVVPKGKKNYETLKSDIPEDKLEDYVGKDVARRLLESKPNSNGDRFLSGIDLKVGSGGMQGFYDKILVDYANKFGKKFGAKVGSVNVNTKRAIERGAPAEGIMPSEIIKPVHSLPITPEMRRTATETGFPLFQGKQGAIEFLKNNEATIHLFEKANPSTYPHELAHWGRRMMYWARDNALPEKKAKLEEMIRTAEQFSGVRNGNWTKPAEEKFARGFERYLRDGFAPTPKLKQVFEQFKQWLTEVYQNIKGSAIDIEIPAEMRRVYDQLLGAKSLFERAEAAGLEINDLQRKAIAAGNKSVIDATERRIEAKGLSAPKSTSSEAELGGYALRPRGTIEMPELVEIAREINEGKYPTIAERLGNKLGIFRHDALEGSIKLKADIFLGEQVDNAHYKTADDAKKDVAEFQKKVADAKQVPESDIAIRMERDRKGGFNLKAYHKDPTLAGKVLAHEIGHLVDWLPDKDMKRGNILGRLATLKNYLTTTIEAKPGQTETILTPKDRIGLHRRAEQETAGVVQGLVKDEKSRVIAERYKELVDAEVEKQNLLTRPGIMDELKKLTQIWKPFNDTNADANYTRYRYSGKELYADAFSVLINEPDLFRKVAPKFSTAWFDYIERKPEVKAVYDEIQDRLKNPEVVQQKRLAEVYDMWKRGDIARDEMNKRLKQNVVSSVKDNVLHWLVDKNHEALKVIRKQEKAGIQEGRIARLALEETENLSARIQDYLLGLSVKVLQPIRDAGLTEKDAATMMFARRVIEERSEFANPLGHTKETAKGLLDTLKENLGEEKYAALDDIVKDYRQIRESEVYPEVRESGLFPSEQMERVEGNKAYGKFSVTKWFDDKMGAGQGVKIYKQIGTLSEIESPFLATIMQDMSLLRAAKLNKTKQELVASLVQAGETTAAEMKWSQDIGGRKALEPRDPKLGLLTYMVDGKPQHVYVSKPIADTFTYAPFEASKIVEVWQTMSQPLREILVSKNPVWMVRNIWRDIRGTIKNNPEIRLRDIPSLLNYYRTALPEVWRDIMEKQRSEDISQAARIGATVANRQYSAREENYNTEIERISAEFELNPFEVRESMGLKGRLKATWEYLNKLGRVSEQWGKMAGFKYLKENTTLPERELSHRVRTRIGTPDVKRKGSLQLLTNNIFLFSNVNKEGVRSSVEAFNEDRGAYIWKTLAMNILPKLILIAAASQSDDLKKIMRGISDYDKRLYTIIPIGLDENGKSVYLRIPEDYEGQLFGALAWDMAHGKGQQTVEDAGNANPYKPHPFLQVGSDLYSYYVNGINPVDDWSGSPVIPRLSYEVGGWPANKAMLKHAWRNLGGSVIYNPKYDELVKSEEPLEKMFKTFPLTVFGTFLRTSDQGQKEQLQNIADEVSKSRAGKSIQAKDIITNSINRMGGEFNADEVKSVYNALGEEEIIDKNIESLKEFEKRYKRIQVRAKSDPRYDVLVQATSNEEKVAVLGSIRESDPSGFKDFLSSAVLDGVVSKKIAQERFGVSSNPFDVGRDRILANKSLTEEQRTKALEANARAKQAALNAKAGDKRSLSNQQRLQPMPFVPNYSRR